MFALRITREWENILHFRKISSKRAIGAHIPSRPIRIEPGGARSIRGNNTTRSYMLLYILCMILYLWARTWAARNRAQSQKSIMRARTRAQGVHIDIIFIDTRTNHLKR